MEYEKMNVDVICEHTSDGRTKPLQLRTRDGKIFNVDRCISVERAEAANVGGCGMRYTVLIQGVIKFLFEDNGTWFVEAFVC